MLFASLSITAIVANLLLWVFYLLVMKKLKPIGFITIIVIFAGIVALYIWGLRNPNVPVLGDLVARIDEKLVSLSVGDMSDVTTGRTTLAKQNFEFYLSQSILTIIFGGISVNCRHVHPALSQVSHNEFVDLLLNVGIVGAVIMVGFFLVSYFSYVKKYYRSKESHDLCIVMIKTIWLLYAVALTTFLDFKFMLMFLL